MFRQISAAVGNGGLMAIVATADIKKPSKVTHCHAETTTIHRKPSELPMYGSIYSLGPNVLEIPHKESATRRVLEGFVSVVRIEVSSVCRSIASQKESVDKYLNSGKDQISTAVHYFNQPGNTVPRVGVIVAGGLSGLILALRGGFIRRFSYTMFGSGIVASVCYPKEAAGFAQQGIFEAKRMATIVYNFAFDVKPGKNVLSIDGQKLSSLSSLFTDLYQNAKESLFPSEK